MTVLAWLLLWYLVLAVIFSAAMSLASIADARRRRSLPIQTIGRGLPLAIAVPTAFRRRR